MMRANLLPRPKERVGLAGIDVDAEYLRQALFALAIVAIVALAGVGIESLRISRLEAAADEQDRIVASHAPMRAQIKALALEVARYQSFAREAQAYRRSGADAAIALARIGNSVPANVWLTSLEHQSAGYDVVGGAESVDQLGSAMLSLGHAMPSSAATLVNIDNREREGTVRFTARVGGTAIADAASAAAVRMPVQPRASATIVP